MHSITLTFTDKYSCYLMYRRELVNPAELKSDGWAQHAEILGLVARRGRIFYEVPVNYSGCTYAEGKKIRYWHAIAVIDDYPQTFYGTLIKLEKDRQ